MLKRLWREDEGVLTFEWILLLTVLVIGITGGLSAVRDAINEELSGVVGAMLSLDQSYSISAPYAVQVGSGSNGQTCAAAGGVSSRFTDNLARYGIGRYNGVANTVVAGNLVPCAGS